MNAGRKAAAAQRMTYWLQACGLSAEEAAEVAGPAAASVLFAADQHDEENWVLRIDFGEESQQELDCAVSNALLGATPYDSRAVCDTVISVLGYRPAA